MISILQRLLSIPLFRKDRLAVFTKSDGNLYFHDGNVEQQIVTGNPDVDLIPMWPVGSIYVSVLSTNPATLFGFGTWVRFGEGRTVIGQQAADADFDTAEEVGGEKNVTLTETTIPSHTHIQDSHNHTQDAHNHTQDAHNHTQDSHRHFEPSGMALESTGSSWDSFGSVGGVNRATAASTQGATATNQATTATNQATTATNQATTATNQNTGGGLAHSNMPPYFVVYMWKRTA